ncbi:hypothetical protein XENOCAPTIV_005942 [Xenoophorus captivus]|uniref:proteasome endopeptidase complex n=1 Tax=Xenoophorus captivus TaxID=1517983 RepID=A0ABV0Q8X2_9TELE
MAGILVAGWDRRKGGQVYCVPIGGMLVRQPVAVGGSGSTYVYGFMDSNYKPGLNKDQCLELAASALSLAMERDGSSGGVIRLATISEEGVERRTESCLKEERSRKRLSLFSLQTCFQLQVRLCSGSDPQTEAGVRRRRSSHLSVAAPLPVSQAQPELPPLTSMNKERTPDPALLSSEEEEEETPLFLLFTGLKMKL